MKTFALAFFSLMLATGAATAVADKGEVPPAAVTAPATGVTVSAAALNGSVNPHGAPTAYLFQYGSTTAYGSRVPSLGANAGGGGKAVALTQSISGLSPGTTYHYRIVASNCGGCEEGTAYGADASFTTLASSAETPASPTPGEAPPTRPASPVLFPNQLLSPLSPAGEPLPVLGRSATISSVSGLVTVQTAGGFKPVGATTAIPIGALVDATQGVVKLRTALGPNTSQAVTVWGGRFRVEQKATGHGMTTLIPSAAAHPCARHGRAHASGRHAQVKLWAEDHHGRYSTRGQNSVATVRGTRWETVETCAGTLTRVLRGLVSVRNLHTHRVTVVAAGHSYLARR